MMEEDFCDGFSFVIRPSIWTDMEFAFNTLSQLEDYCDEYGFDIEEVEIFLGEYANLLSDDDYDAFSELRAITDLHLKLYEDGELYDGQIIE